MNSIARYMLPIFAVIVVVLQTRAALPAADDVREHTEVVAGLAFGPGDSSGRVKGGDEWQFSSQWALNGKRVIKDGKLVMTPEAWKPMEMDLDNPQDIVVNKHTLTPPGAEGERNHP